MRKIDQNEELFASKHAGKLVPDFDLLCNGEVWEIVRGEDFSCKTSSMRTRLASEARYRGLKLRTRMPEPDKLIVQAFSVGPVTNVTPPPSNE